jgi:hypothetical protein
MYAIPPYQKTSAAAWLYKLGWFDSPKDALFWLDKLENKNPAGYKVVMSKYYYNNEYHSKYMSMRNVNKYHTSNAKSYGEEPHMWM